MKHYTIVGNWKMHQTPQQAATLIDRLQGTVKPHTHVTSVVCPPFVDLAAVHAQVQPDVLSVGAQNLHDEDEGAFTGEVSGPMLKGLAEYVLVGHSERRRYFHETDRLIAKKLAAAIRNGLKPILCIGENLSDRHDGHSKRVVVDQLHGALHHMSADDLGGLVIAYEPVWAIGTGEFATPSHVEPIVSVIRLTLDELFGRPASSGTEVLYGGSVDANNARSFLEMEHVNGLLVGGASLNYQSFSAIIAAAQSLAE